MHRYDLAHLSDSVLIRDLTALVVKERTTTADLLAHIAEVDARRLYAPAGYSSMFAYCVEELRLSEDAAAKRIQAARIARRFPKLFAAVDDGRIHLAGVCLLAPHLNPDNAEDLIAAAVHRSKAEIEAMLASRFPAPDAPAIVRILSAARAEQHAPGHVGQGIVTYGERASGHAAGESDRPQQESGELPTSNEHAPGHVQERYLVQVTISKSTHDKLRHVQALLSHAVAKGDVAEVLDRALDALIVQLEKRKFAASSAGREQRRPGARTRPRFIPAPVKRAVWERDQGQCTFVSEGGKRCSAHQYLEFDHVEPVARGGKATVHGLRLRCRAHNQYEAERAFGSDFMRRKRMEAKQSRDLLAGLRSLGCRAGEARRAAEFTETLQGATLEQRMRAALEFLGSRSRSLRVNRLLGTEGKLPSETVPTG